MPSFLSKPARLFYRAGFGPGPKTGLRAGLTGLVLFGHLYRIPYTYTVLNKELNDVGAHAAGIEARAAAIVG